MSEDERSPQASIGDCPRTDAKTSPAFEENREDIHFHKSSTPHFQVGLGMSVETLHKGLSKDLSPQPNSGEYQPSPIPKIHEYEYMHPNFMKGHLLGVDPFAILTCLLLSVSTFFPIIDTSNLLWKKSACNTLFINYLS
jgi:hypothetical protein